MTRNRVQCSPVNIPGKVISILEDVVADILKAGREENFCPAKLEDQRARRRKFQFQNAVDEILQHKYGVNLPSFMSGLISAGFAVGISPEKFVKVLATRYPLKVLN